MKRYGITFEQRQVMAKLQKNRCALCNKHEREFSRRLHVDHNHKSKKVRGLLCYFCNRRRVGRLDLFWAKKIYEYLLKYE